MLSNSNAVWYESVTTGRTNTAIVSGYLFVTVWAFFKILGPTLTIIFYGFYTDSRITIRAVFIILLFLGRE